MDEREHCLRSPGGTAAWVSALILATSAALIAFNGVKPPAVVGIGAPATEFSAERAQRFWNALLPQQLPHPLGSAENQALRQRLLSQLGSMGYSPQVLSTLGCSEKYMVCGPVHDVIATLTGQSSTALLLIAHYDSVPAGPGVGDDLSGVAALLEIARALRAAPPPETSVIFLFSDGEEEGLLGANAFAQHSPMAARVRAVLNIDSRLMRPPCLMFETGPGNLELIRLLAGAPHPSGASWVTWAYRHMPNDTDFSVFENLGIAGLNFACTGPENLYHTPRDTFSEQDPRALQQVGGNMLHVAKELVHGDLSRSMTRQEAVFTDLAHRTIVLWPAYWSWILGLGALSSVLLLLVGWKRRRQQNFGDLAWATAGIVGVLVVPTLAAAALADFLSRVHGVDDWWAAHPLAPVLLWPALTWWMAAAISATTGRRCSAQALYTVNTLIWALASLALAITSPPLCVDTLLPTLAAVPTVAWMAATRRPPSALLYLPPAVLAAFLLTEDYVNAAAALTPGAGLVLSGLTVLAFSWLAPFHATVWRRALLRRAEHLLALSLTLVAFIAALASPAYDSLSPQRLNLLYVQRSGDAAGALMMGRFSRQLQTGKALGCDASPATRAICLALARPFTRQSAKLRPWLGPSDRYAARVAGGNAPGPQLAILDQQRDGDARTLHLRLSSPRNGDGIWLFLPVRSRPVEVEIAGEKLYWAHADKTARRPQPAFGLFTPDAKSVDIRLRLRTTEPLTATLLDVRYGLPPSLRQVATARPASAVPLQFGDAWLIYTMVNF